MQQTEHILIRKLLSAHALVVVSMVVIGGTFFIAEHQPDISTSLDFTAEIDEQESWASGGDKLRQVAFITFALFGAFGLTRRNKGEFTPTATMMCALAYVALAGASIFWSTDPSVSARRFIVLLCTVVGAIGIGRLLTTRQIIAVAIGVFASFLCLGVVTELALGTFRPHFAEYRFAGTVHPNTQGAYLALLCLACFTMLRTSPRHRIWFGLLLFIAVAFLLLTRSRTACAALIVAAAAMWLVTSSSARLVHIFAGAAWVISVAAVLVMASGFNPVTEYADVLLLGRQEESGSLTGRIPIWTDLWAYVQQRPLAGYGYDAFWSPRHIYEISTSQEWALSESHSSYLGTCLQLGFIGVALLTWTALSGVVESATHFRRTGDATFLFCMGGLVFCLLRGVTESGMGSPSALTIFLAAGLAGASFAIPSASGLVEPQQISDAVCSSSRLGKLESQEH